MNRYDREYYKPQIDILKGIFIIWVILLHVLPDHIIKDSYSQFHIWNAVLLFIFLMGYNFAHYIKHNNFDLNSYIKKSILRIIPSLIIVVMFVEFIPIRSVHYFYDYKYFLDFPYTIKGPGGYFIPILIQSIVILPIFYKLYKKINNKFNFLLLAFFINLTFELISIQIPFIVHHAHFLYYSNILRYVFLISLSFYIYDCKYKLNNKLMLYGLLFSIFYLLSYKYYWNNIFISNSWQNILSFMYISFLFYVMNYFFRKYSRFFEYLIIIGKSSYHIFLFQILFFYYIFTIKSYQKLMGG